MNFPLRLISSQRSLPRHHPFAEIDDPAVVRIFICQVDPRGVQAMRDYLDRFWDRALAAFKLAAEQEDS